MKRRKYRKNRQGIFLLVWMITTYIWGGSSSWISSICFQVLTGALWELIACKILKCSLNAIKVGLFVCLISLIKALYQSTLCIKHLIRVMKYLITISKEKTWTWIMILMNVGIKKKKAKCIQAYLLKGTYTFAIIMNSKRNFYKCTWMAVMICYNATFWICTWNQSIKLKKNWISLWNM